MHPIWWLIDARWIYRQRENIWALRVITTLICFQRCSGIIIRDHLPTYYLLLPPCACYYVLAPISLPNLRIWLPCLLLPQEPQWSCNCAPWLLGPKIEESVAAWPRKILSPLRDEYVPIIQAFEKGNWLSTCHVDHPVDPAMHLAFVSPLTPTFPPLESEISASICICWSMIEDQWSTTSIVSIRNNRSASWFIIRDSLP